MIYHSYKQHIFDVQCLFDSFIYLKNCFINRGTVFVWNTFSIFVDPNGKDYFVTYVVRMASI